MTKKRVDVELLKELGFPQQDIDEARTRERLGVLEVQPPRDLVERTITACSKLLASAEAPTASNRLMDFVEAIVGLASGANPQTLKTLESSFVGLRHAMRLRDAYLHSLPFALTTKDRPMVILENHNLIEPGWWDQHPGFILLRAQCRHINDVVTEQRIAPCARLVVLRKRVSDYADAELESLASLLQASTSDVWWTPVSKAGDLANRDAVVIGDKEIVIMDQGGKSPGRVLQAAKIARDPSRAMRLRGTIEKAIGRAKLIKKDGRLSTVVRDVIDKNAGADGMRRVLSKIIERRATTRMSLVEA